MKSAFENALKTAEEFVAAKDGELPSLVAGSNIAGFVKVAQAMHDQGDWWTQALQWCIPLQDVQNGHYSISIQFSGNVGGIKALDSNDDENYTSGNVVSNGHNADFGVTDVTAAGEVRTVTIPLPAG
ncbi:hypothetical protein NQ176_g11303 [Zarea fungicola]|uniref:Uncharacterized protein n=1 Tax=Zarea fungicola TaxID=93591 RepID=A0ACC1MD29_9HYPO|nr:hypothetical protein NQ176_g11303 [Lecanicillium fungicola]